jgi:hypothetical protein
MEAVARMNDPITASNKANGTSLEVALVRGIRNFGMLAGYVRRHWASQEETSAAE